MAARLCALPLENVAETMRRLPIEPLAEMPASVLGLSIIRGQPVPVIEAGRLFDDTTAEPKRFVTIKISNRLVALAVDSVLGVRSIEAASSSALPPLLGDATGAVVSAIAILDAEFLLFLRTVCIIPQELPDNLFPGGQAP